MIKISRTKRFGSIDLQPPLLCGGCWEGLDGRQKNIFCLGPLPCINPIRKKTCAQKVQARLTVTCPAVTFLSITNLENSLYKPCNNCFLHSEQSVHPSISLLVCLSWFYLLGVTYAVFMPMLYVFTAPSVSVSPNVKYQHIFQLVG